MQVLLYHPANEIHARRTRQSKKAREIVYGTTIHTRRKRNNRSKSKIRCCVEHVFGFIERSMGGLVFRGIGIVRAKANVAMTNLTYNVARLTQIYRYHKEWITM